MRLILVTLVAAEKLSDFGTSAEEAPPFEHDPLTRSAHQGPHGVPHGGPPVAQYGVGAWWPWSSKAEPGSLVNLASHGKGKDFEAEALLAQGLLTESTELQNVLEKTRVLEARLKSWEAKLRAWEEELGGREKALAKEQEQLKECKERKAHADEHSMGARVHDHEGLKVVEEASADPKKPGMGESDEAAAKADVDASNVVIGHEVAIPLLGAPAGNLTDPVNFVETKVQDAAASIGNFLSCMGGACPPNAVDASADGPHQPHHDAPHAASLESL